MAVTVYEAAAGAGGKARSIFVPGTGKDGRRDLPGEHGFRFFPSFYRHLPDTMKRIPFGQQPNGVHDNLTATARTRLARILAPPVDVITRFPKTRADWQQLIRTIVVDDIGLPPGDALYLGKLFLLLLTTCPQRRLAEHEPAAWWDFTGADRRSQAFRQYFADIAVRSLVAMCPRKASTRTIGSVGLQLWLDHARPGAEVDRLLNGPTSDVWLSPWVAHLQRLGVRFRWRSRVTAIEITGRRVSHAVVESGGGGTECVRADHYVAALPVERMQPLVSPAMMLADPRLAGIHALTTEWMTGAQFFLGRKLPVVRGHLVLVDSPWAVTAISQSQFWPGTDLRQFGDGRVREVLSAIISNWDLPGAHVRKPARECTAAELRQELWWQLRAHLRRSAIHLAENDLVDFYLADSIEFRQGRPHDREPLFINTAGSWVHRPDSATAIENLFLAADYVRTNTDLATMESANEAARRATNGILDAAGVVASRCQIWPLREPLVFRPLQMLDHVRWQQGRPHLLEPALT
jgi:uncharacterized protein with NAD-binding domain and iron-sulfur cluster